MNHIEAKELLAVEVAKYRKWSYADLVKLIENPPGCVTVSGVSNAKYQIEVNAHRDAQPAGDVRVVGSIDDGGWRAFLPLSDSFIVAPGGTISG